MGLAPKRDDVWQRRVVEKEREALTACLADLSGAERAKTLRKLLRQYRADPSFLAQLKAVLLLIESLHAEASHATLDREGVLALKASAEKILLAHKVRPKRSRLSFLHADLQEALAAWEASQGQGWNVSWRRQMALRAADTAGDELAHARRLLRWGDAPEAIRTIEASPLTAESALWRVRAYRLTGDVFRAQALAEEARARFPESAELYRWETCLGETQLGGPAVLWEIFLELTPLRQWELAFWCLATMSRDWLSRRPTATALKKTEVPASLLEALDTLDRAYLSSENLSSMLERVGTLLGKGDAFAEIEQELLVTAAAVRWLHRIRQRALCAQALARYRSLSLTLSSGATADVLGQLSDILEERESGYQRSIRTGYLGRSFAIGSLSVEIMAAIGRRRLGQLFGPGNRSARLKESEAAAVIDIATRHLSSLKGPIMKVGQTASYFGIELPPLSAEILSRLQADSQPLAPSQVRALVAAELGAPLEKLFAQWTDEPIGVGSIGQVHLAALPSGKKVAVKVRYPGIEKAIESDVLILRTMLPVIRLLNSQAIPQETLSELRERLLEECDYRREARLQKAFRRKFESHSGIYIPEVIDSHSSEGVLTTEWVTGMTLSEFKRTCTAEQRTRAGELLMEFVLGSCRDGMFNADPHPGNFLFRPEGLIALDFGSVKLWNKDDAFQWSELVRSCVYSDYELFRRTLLQMGVVANARNFDYRQYFDIMMDGSMSATTAPEPRAFESRRLHKEMIAMFGPSNPNQRHTYLNPSYLYGMRVYSGLISILSELGAEANYHAHCGNILKEDAATPAKYLAPPRPFQITDVTKSLGT